LGAFVGNYPGVLAAMVALGLMAVVVVMSVGMARRRMKYETWYFIHLYAYMGVVLAFSHQLATGVDFAGNPAFVGYWIALYGITAWILLWSRLGGVLRKHQKHALKVAGVTKEAKGVFSIYISGRNLQDLKAEAGQAAWWRFMDSKRWWQAHPFSISDRTDGKRLRITVKNIGDFTREIHNLKVGTPVLMEGPFGKFIERGEGEKVLLVAGGIGITPLRALAEEMLEEGLDVHLIYRVHSEGDIVFKQELEALKAKGLKIDYSLGTGTKKTSREAWVRPESLAKWVEDVAEREAWVCGPKEMTEAVVESLLEAGVKRGQIQTEVFRLQ
jgi:predicted ferric reductase